MEPNFESKPSGEFEKDSHHIFTLEDVVFAFSDVDEESEYGVVSDCDYLMFINDIARNKKIGPVELIIDAMSIEKMVRDNRFSRPEDDEYTLQYNPALTAIAEQMRNDYTQKAELSVQELNSFLAKNPKLLHLSSEAGHEVDELKTYIDEIGQVIPLFEGNTLYVDTRQLDEKYRSQVLKALSQMI